MGHDLGDRESEHAMASVEARAIEPLRGPFYARLRLPGSKSIMNRALVLAAQAPGRSLLEGCLFADDTWAMMEGIRAMGAKVLADPAHLKVEVEGGPIPLGPARIDARDSGTTGRFLLPIAGLGQFYCVLDGSARLRERPFGALLEALRSLGAEVRAGPAGSLPVSIRGPLLGGEVALPGDTTSQFLSGLMMAAPRMAKGLSVKLTSPLVSRPYVSMTAALMRRFGAEVDEGEFLVPPGSYRPIHLLVEPDASSASYFFALAAICGGRVVAEGLGVDSPQADVAFVELLARMGAEVRADRDAIEVRGVGELEAISADMRDCSDTAPTLAVAAAFARGTTRISGIGFIRKKESDRIAAIASELRRAGIEANELEDGIEIRGGRPRRARFATYRDHRVAMAMAVLAAGGEGGEIEDPGCVGKTFPQFFEVLEAIAKAEGSLVAWPPRD